MVGSTRAPQRWNADFKGADDLPSLIFAASSPFVSHKHWVSCFREKMSCLDLFYLFTFDFLVDLLEDLLSTHFTTLVNHLHYEFWASSEEDTLKHVGHVCSLTNILSPVIFETPSVDMLNGEQRLIIVDYCWFLWLLLSFQRFHFSNVQSSPSKTKDSPDSDDNMKWLKRKKKNMASSFFTHLAASFGSKDSTQKPRFFCCLPFSN